MAFCASCGAEAPGNFCPKCGAPVTAGPAPGAGPAYASAPVASGLAENVAGALCYLVGFITGILFLVLEPYNKNPRIRFHAFQAIFFHLAWIVLWIGVTIFSIFLPFALHILVSLLMMVVGLGGFVLWLMLMFKAYNNTPLVLPIVGPLAQQQAGS